MVQTTEVQCVPNDIASDGDLSCLSAGEEIDTKDLYEAARLELEQLRGTVRARTYEPIGFDLGKSLFVLS